MTETVFQGQAEENAEQVEEQAKEPVTVALSADDFSALEERIVRAVELVRKERAGRIEAEERAAQAEARASQAEARVGEETAHVERLEHDIKQLRGERDHVRQRVEKLLKQLDELEL
jgi:hypothetical protein